MGMWPLQVNMILELGVVIFSLSFNLCWYGWKTKEKFWSNDITNVWP